MKKVITYLMLSSTLIFTGCKNYDSRFDEILSQINGINTRLAQVETLTAQIATISATVTQLMSEINSLDNATELAALKAQLTDVLAKLADLTGKVASNSTDLAALQAEIAALQAQVNDIIASSSFVNENITITTKAQLEYAAALGNKLNLVNGNLSITYTSSSDFTAAELSAVTSNIKMVLGNLTVSTTASLDLSNLNTVLGTYYVSGSDVNDASLATVGTLVASYDGAYDFPALTTSTNILLVDYETTASSSASSSKFSNGPVMNASQAGTTGTTSYNFINVEECGVFATVDSNLEGNSGYVSATSAESLIFGSGISVYNIVAPKAKTIQIWNTGTLSGSLYIWAPLAESAVIKYSVINGLLEFIGGANTVVDFTDLKTIDGDANVAAGTVNLSKLTTVTGIIFTFSDNLTINSALSSNHISATSHFSATNHLSGGSHVSGTSHTTGTSHVSGSTHISGASHVSGSGSSTSQNG